MAILLVLGSHYDYFHVWARIGWMGVDLFFVLSGFLISGLLFSEYKRTGQLDLKRFWIRRGFKIYPAFYTLIGFTVICLLVQRRPLPVTLLHDSLYLGNYLPHFWDHAWSLAVEEHFYFALPILLLVLIKLSKNKSAPFRAIPAISIVLTIGCLYLRNRAFSAGAPWTSIEWPTHLRIDSLFAGVTLGYYYHFEPLAIRNARRMWLWIAAAVLLAPVVLLSLHHVFMAPTFTLTFAAFCCVLVAMLNRPASRGFASRALAVIGSYSYSIYLWHAALVGLFFRFFAPTLPLFAAYVAASILIGVAMTKAVERPALVLRERWFPSAGRAKAQEHLACLLPRQSEA